MQDTMGFQFLLRKLRRQRDMTRQALATCAGCSTKTIQKIEAGERRPSRQIAGLLAECLGVPEEERAEFVALARSAPTTSYARLKGNLPGQNAGRATLNDAQVIDQRTGRQADRKRDAGYHNLPSQAASFVGRASELEAARALLGRPNVRLVTFTGPPGVGKTRLAVEVTMSLLSLPSAQTRCALKESTVFVPLSSATDAESVLSHIARGLGVQVSDGQVLLEEIEAHLRHERVLLLLDNFEHVMDVAPLLSRLLEAAPRLKMLVTSRELLRLRGEHIFQVAPLALPNGCCQSYEQLAQNEAVSLFVERAAATRPGFALTEENIGTVVEICKHLDGLPLAIELAAERMRTFDPAYLLDRFGQPLALLTKGARDLPERHRTLRSALDWSYNLLDNDHKALFRCLAVFESECSWEGVQAVCDTGARSAAEIFDALVTLVEKSLLSEDTKQAEPGALRGIRGFRMLNTIREYGLERLEQNGELEHIRRRYTRYCSRLAEQAAQL